MAPEAIWKDYETLLAAIRKTMPTVPLFVESILPLSPKDAEEYDGFNARAELLNSFLATPEAQAKYNYRYLDLAASLRDEQGDLGDTYTTDGCHLTPAAYQIWADQLREALSGLKMR
jgi:lysophospholipase L1-like esterase